MIKKASERVTKSINFLERSYGSYWYEAYKDPQEAIQALRNLYEDIKVNIGKTKRPNKRILSKRRVPKRIQYIRIQSSFITY